MLIYYYHQHSVFDMSEQIGSGLLSQSHKNVSEKNAHC
jgi:hypothetical protein